MNNSPRVAAAARNTALFHIGSRPRITPEKIKPGNVAPKRSDVTLSCFSVSVNTAGEDVPVCDSATLSVATPGVGAFDPAWDNTSGCGAGASAEATS